MEPGGNAKLLAIQTTSDIESAKFGRGRVVGVTFQTGTEFEELRAGQCSFAQFIERMHDTKTHRDAASQAARWRNIAVDRNGKRERSDTRCFEEELSDFAHHRRQASGAASNHGHIVVNLKRDAETVETRAEIGGAGRDANSDGVLHGSKIATTR